MPDGCSYKYSPLSIARYSFIQLALGFNTASQDSNPGSHSRESEAEPLCLLLYLVKTPWLPRSSTMAVHSYHSKITFHAVVSSRLLVFIIWMSVCVCHDSSSEHVLPVPVSFQLLNFLHVSSSSFCLIGLLCIFFRPSHTTHVL